MAFDYHTRRIVDERLKFTKFVNSGKPLNISVAYRPDLIAFNSPTFLRPEIFKGNPTDSTQVVRAMP